MKELFSKLSSISEFFTEKRFIYDANKPKPLPTIGEVIGDKSEDEPKPTIDTSHKAVADFMLKEADKNSAGLMEGLDPKFAYLKGKDGQYEVDFKDRDATETFYGLRDFFKVPALIVAFGDNKRHKDRPNGDTVYAVRKEDGNYYDIRTSKYVPIYSGDLVDVSQRSQDTVVRQMSIDKDRARMRSRLAVGTKAREAYEIYAGKLGDDKASAEKMVGFLLKNKNYESAYGTVKFWNAVSDGIQFAKMSPLNKERYIAGNLDAKTAEGLIAKAEFKHMTLKQKQDMIAKYMPKQLKDLGKGAGDFLARIGTMSLEQIAQVFAGVGGLTVEGPRSMLADSMIKERKDRETQKPDARMATRPSAADSKK